MTGLAAPSAIPAQGPDDHSARTQARPRRASVDAIFACLVLVVTLGAGGARAAVGTASTAATTGTAAPSVGARPAGVVNVKDFGAVGDGIHDDTAAIQKAVNAASFSLARNVHIPAGRYAFTTVRAYHDPSLNPGFNPSGLGDLTIEGDRMPPEILHSGGTVLVTTVASGNGFILNPASSDAKPYPSRNIVVRDIGFEGATTGFLVESAGVPGARFTDCQFVQHNASGSGLFISTAYFGTISNCRFMNRGAGLPTGDAIRMTSSIPAGLFKIVDSNIQGFGNALHYAGGLWQSMSIYSSELQGRSHGVLVDGGSIELLTLVDTYWEGGAESFVAEAPGPARIKSLVAISTWSYGPGLTGPAFKLNSPDALLFEGIVARDQNTPFLEIATPPAGGQGSYVVNGAAFPRGAKATAPVTLFTGVVPVLNGATYAFNDPLIALYPPSAHPVDSRLQVRGVSQISVGRISLTHLKKYTDVANDIYHNAQGLQGAVDITNTKPMSFLLADGSSGIPQGFSVYVKNNLRSAGPVTVRPQSGLRPIAVLQPGQAQWFFFDRDGSDDWF